MWCLAHRLELAVKDSFKNTSFDQIDDMLLKLYYMYEKSPKKCRQLEYIIIDGVVLLLTIMERDQLGLVDPAG